MTDNPAFWHLYTLYKGEKGHMHPARPHCQQWTGTHPSHSHSLLMVEKGTPCTSTLLAVTPYMPILLAVEMDTPCTSMLLAEKRDTLCMSVLLAVERGYPLPVNTAGGGKGMPCKSLLLAVVTILYSEVVTDSPCALSLAM
jgi:hypothetical protein